MRIRRSLALALVALGLIASACGTDGGGDTITVGSADFTESVTLAEIYAQGLEAKGFPTDTKLRIGSREVYFPALQDGEIDLVPDYVASAVGYLTEQAVSADPDVTKAIGQLQQELPEELVAFEPADAADQDAVVVTRATADELNLTKVSDLAAVDQDFIFAGPAECPNRIACLKGLTEVYGLSFKEFKPLAPNGPTTVDLLKSGEVQAANVFTSNPQIEINDFVVLDDDRGTVGAENVVPIVRTASVDEHEGLGEALDAISAKLTTEALIELNRKTDTGTKQDPEDVAREWLEDNDLL